jgi:peptidoglycan/LPS O-acetylase OafA/YrhL
VTTTSPAPTPAPAERVPRPDVARFPCFEGLRAFAALAVLLYHVFLATTPEWVGTEAWDWIDRLGSFGVCVFFLISGFLLYRPFVVAHFEDRPSPGVRDFWTRRFMRIFPAYWLALTVSVYVFGVNSIRGNWEDVITFYGLLQSYRGGYPLLGMDVAWSLVIEVSFYIALPFIAWAVRAFAKSGTTVRKKLKVQLVGLAVLYALAVVARVWWWWGLDSPSVRKGTWFPLGQLPAWLVGYLDWFALGMLLAVGSAWLAKGGGLPWIVRALARAPVACWLLALELYWVTLQLHLGEPFARGNAWQALGLAFFHGACAFFFIFPAVFGPQDRGAIRGFLRSRVMVFLGVISYGIYLWHKPYTELGERWAGDGAISDDFLTQLVLILALTVATATVSYYVLERPLINWSRRIRRRPRVGATSPGGAGRA